MSDETDGSTKELYKVPEAAAFMGVSVATVKRWIASGRLPKVQPGGPGGRVWVRHDDLVAAVVPKVLR